MKNMQNKFESLTVFLLAANETDSMEQIVTELQHICCSDDVKEIVIMLKDAYCPSVKTAQNLSAQDYDIPVKYFVQEKKGIQSAFYQCSAVCETSHLVIMSSDGEMDVNNIPEFIEHAKKSPNNIIIASKWNKDSVVYNYKKSRKIFSRLVSGIVAFMYGVSITDVFTIFRMYPTALFKLLNYGTYNIFGVYFLIYPLRVRVRFQEIATHWKPRENENTTNLKNDIKYALLFLCAALVIRFIPTKKIISDYEAFEKFIK